MCNGYGYVCVGQQIAVGVVDGDDALAYVAGAVGDDGGGARVDVSVPGLIGLRFPDDFDRLTGGELADLGLVEVGADANAVEVGYVDEDLRRPGRSRTRRRAGSRRCRRWGSGC